MNVTRSRVAVVSNIGQLWTIGGCNGMKNLSTVETYIPETNEWSFVAQSRTENLKKVKAKKNLGNQINKFHE